MTKKTMRIVLVAVGAAAVAVFAIIMLSVIPGQRAKLRELDAEKQRLRDQLNELLIRHEGLEEMLEYTGSVEFLLRYARENLGFMLEGDIRVDVNDPNAVVLTLPPNRPNMSHPDDIMPPESDAPAESQQPDI